MKNLVFVFLLLLSTDGLAQDKTTTFILVRHAEKASADPDTELSAEGHERAKRLAALLKNTSIHSVYSTKYKRTQNTVAPVAKDKNLTISTYDKLDQPLLAELLAEHAGETILVAGHSNTIPTIANTLLGKNEFQNFPDSEYGNILIITVTGKIASVLRLNY